MRAAPIRDLSGLPVTITAARATTGTRHDRGRSQLPIPWKGDALLCSYSETDLDDLMVLWNHALVQSLTTTSKPAPRGPQFKRSLCAQMDKFRRRPGVVRGMRLRSLLRLSDKLQCSPFDSSCRSLRLLRVVDLILPCSYWLAGWCLVCGSFAQTPWSSPLFTCSLSHLTVFACYLDDLSSLLASSLVKWLVL